MFLDLKDIGGQGLSFDDRPALSSMDAEDGSNYPVTGARIEGTAVPSDRGVELRARVSARVEVGCARCLEPVGLNVSGEVFLVLVGEDEPQMTGEIEISAADADIYLATAGRVDLDEVAREQIDLLLPVRTVCSAECKGLCPECGENRNLRACGCGAREIDPRLAPLLRWKGTNDPNRN